MLEIAALVCGYINVLVIQAFVYTRMFLAIAALVCVYVNMLAIQAFIHI